MARKINLQNELHLYMLILEVKIFYFNFPIMFIKPILTHVHAENAF